MIRITIKKAIVLSIGNTTLITSDAVAADAAYVYHAFAVGTNFVSSGPSNNDVASSFVFTPVSPGQQIAFADFDAVLQHGINNFLIATGNPTRSWHDIDNVSGPGAQMLALRCAMDRALTSAGIPLTAYTDSSLGNVIIKAVHITELQNRTK